MKKLLFFAALIFLFMFILFKSNAWETYKDVEIRQGAEYVSYKHRMRWDRFLDYIKEMPEKAMKIAGF